MIVSRVAYFACLSCALATKMPQNARRILEERVCEIEVALRPAQSLTLP